MHLRIPFSIMLVLAGLLVFSIASASTVRISKLVPGSVNINVISIQAMADVDGNGMVDGQDLLAVAGAIGTQPGDNPPADINRDGVVDVFDLALVARYFGQEV